MAEPLVPATRPGVDPPLLTPVAETTRPVGDERRRLASSRWYGPSVLLVDLVGGGVLAGGSRMEARLQRAGMGALLVGAPVIHLQQRRGGRALTSLSLRVALPVVGYMVWMRRDTCASFQCQKEGSWWGAAVGSAIASLVDVALLSREDAHVALSASGTTMVPVVRAVNGAPSFGVGGTF